MFNWDDLRSFIEVTRTKSLLRAATKLGVNHTTVARRIQALEESLSTQLFDKTPAGYMLTDTGTQLLRLAEQIETTAISAVELVASQSPEVNGTVRLSITEGIGSHFLMHHVGEFYAKYPGVELEIVALPQSLSISKREVDIAITLSQPTVGRLVSRALTNYRLRIYGTRRYFKRKTPPKRAEDLTRHRLIGNVYDMIYAPQHRCFDDVLPNAHVGLRVQSINAQLSAVESDLGLGLLPCYIASQRKGLVSVLEEEATLTRTLWISMHEDMRHVHRVAAVWNWLKDIVQANQPLLLGE